MGIFKKKNDVICVKKNYIHTFILLHSVVYAPIAENNDTMSYISS